MAHFEGEMIKMQCLFTCSVNKSCYCAKPSEFLPSSGIDTSVNSQPYSLHPPLLRYLTFSLNNMLCLHCVMQNQFALPHCSSLVK